ncbi:MAG: chorismate mutase [Candidatus Nealsonbacteria bacterium]
MKSEKIIQKNRKKLDEITRDITKLIAKRNRIVLKIGKIKKQFGLPVTDLKRDKEVIKKAKTIAKKTGVNIDAIEKIIKILIKHAKEIQKK